MDDTRAVFEAVVQAQSAGEASALATVIGAQGSVPRHPGSKMLVRADGTFVGTVGGGAMEAQVMAVARQVIADGQPRTERYTLNDVSAGDPGVCGGTVEVFIEPIAHGPTLIVIGMGHVGKALADLGKWMGLRVIVTDDREALCSPEVVPGMDGYVVCAPAEVPDRVSLNERSYVAAVTRGMPVDLTLIPALLRTPAAYIGVIGSRRRWALTARALQDQAGLSEADLGRVHAPIGLEIQAETPREIAISIMAEIIQVMRGGDGRSMRWMGAPEAAQGAPD